MLHFKNLRLNGFKSFVDRTMIDIGPGLTGIIGPNGCGKSNILDGLRWTMGEASAKKMRGGEMDDVIFAGSASRSRRMSADVTIILDNATRSAPAAFNDNDTIEITRKIERDSGSTYKINGRTVRARDVQFLFADTLTGAHSPALVSQGRITSIISAKPYDRRQILEDSAGISGLYQRRHEAEIRLRAADENLLRLEDLLDNLNARYNVLHRQAKEARQYRELNANIRELEIQLFALNWHLENHKLKESKNAFETSERNVESALKVVNQLAHTEKVLSDELPELRKREAEAAASFQAYNISIQRLDEEEERTKLSITDITNQLEQIETDHKHTDDTLKENQLSFEKIQDEITVLQDQDNASQDCIDELKEQKQNAKDKRIQAEREYHSYFEKQTKRQSRLAHLKHSISQHELKLKKATTQLADLQQSLDDKKANDKNAQIIDELKSNINSCETQLELSKNKQDSLYKDLEASRSNYELINDKYNIALSDKNELEHEISALQNIVALSRQDDNKPIINELDVEPGFEEGLTAALGCALSAPRCQDTDSLHLWQRASFDVSQLPKFSTDIKTLDNFVKAPKELERALKMIGVVPKGQDGNALKDQLKPGQSLIDTHANFWRWDGYTLKSGYSNQQNAILKQQNRLKDCLKSLEKKTALCDQLCKEKTDHLDNLNIIEDEYKSSHKSYEDQASYLLQLQKDLQTHLEDFTKTQTHIAKLEEAIDLACKDVQETQNHIQESRASLKNESTSGQDENDNNDNNHTQDLKLKLEAFRQDEIQAEQIYNNAIQEKTRRDARLRAISDERMTIQNRTIRAKKHLEDLKKRKTLLDEKLIALKDKPASLRHEKVQLQDSLNELENNRKQACENLAKAENQALDARQALKEAEKALSDSKESRAHAQTSAQMLFENIERLKQRIEDKFDTHPDVLMHADQKAAFCEMDSKDIANMHETLKSKLDKNIYKRDAFTSVNLKADEEIKDVEQRLADLESEHHDLLQAISELRGAIQKLNKQARTRLLEAFDAVNGHFKTLFSRLFQGGEAHLSLVDSDDPLESGLEIFAQPPGKSLQSLSLLSGGEQTLTAIALIFAMFLTNPSPICILDEIDAPLDDSNVDRVCDLLDDVARSGETRFIVITHHRLTMARMDRLYGVTMAEKGVSKLVSVDMHKQMDLLEAASA